MGTIIKRFTADQSGATAIEYGIMIFGIAIVIVAAVEAVGISVAAIFVDVSNSF